MGRVAVHTGEGCIPFAGDVTGEGFSVQANMMASEEVWPAMAEAYSGADAAEPLANRLLLALEAAEAAGGDVRGRQSAAMLVVPAAGESWRSIVDLRVEDHPQPLTELRRLLVLHDAYTLASQGDDLTGEGRTEEAGDLYQRASELAPDNDELLFWSGLAAAQAGDLATGVERVQPRHRGAPRLARSPGPPEPGHRARCGSRCSRRSARTKRRVFSEPCPIRPPPRAPRRRRRATRPGASRATPTGPRARRARTARRLAGCSRQAAGSASR